MAMMIVLAAGGTGGHIFPALSTALALRERLPECGLLWVGTSRSRERELCERHGIELRILAVSGVAGRGASAIGAAITQFVKASVEMTWLFLRRRPSAVVAFGGYVCAPALSAAALLRIPYYLNEQNAVPGRVNRLFAVGARCCFLGLPLSARWRLAGKSRITGMPVRPAAASYEGFAYPAGFKRGATTVLICGGSQGAQSMNRCLIEPARRWAASDLQIVWQTGVPGFKEIQTEMKRFPQVFVADLIDDLYPYYAAATVMIGRAGASTLAEAALFGLPCIVVPLPWAADNHQWMNAALVKDQGWGVRIKQDAHTGDAVDRALERMLGNPKQRETMRRKALECAPVQAARKIAEHLVKDLRS
jgi:UDP-N-acetylglucosamine--N-acetylmuramyl-(pentapeptide) pyrophosphoryl-undecaprenol N-acetylglucosamine transferase